MTVLSTEMTASGKRVLVVKCGACRTEVRASQLNALLNHVDSAAHVAALESGCGREHKVVAWIRDHGDANTMSLVSNDEISASGKCVHVVKCGACRTEIRATELRLFPLLNHVDSAKHVAALAFGCAHKVEAWIREHGDAKMGVEMVLNAKGRRTWNVDCGTCGSKLRGIHSVGKLEAHVKTATHRSAALSSSRATRERKRPRS
jgi:uncharacterized protein YecT (DUF1311 family)